MDIEYDKITKELLEKSPVIPLLPDDIEEDKIPEVKTPEQQYIDDYEDKYHKDDKTETPQKDEEIIEETIEW